MARDEKLSLLKYSMYQMIDVLRAEDRVSIITYSSEVEIHMSGVSGARKTELKDLIFSLNANGQSFGQEGLDRAFELAEEHFIEEGNNEVILASDGVFNSPGFSEKKIYRNVAKKFRKEQVRFTAIGFGNNPHALTFMKTMAHKGNGSFLRIENEEMARTVLITNIMNHSAKSEEGDWFMKE
jgi:Ca-activated chloride channel family protein